MRHIKVRRTCGVAQALRGGNVWCIQQRPSLRWAKAKFPTCLPYGLALFTRAMPAANSGPNNPLSAASTASLHAAGDPHVD